jgi:hypothetical protein
LECLEKILKVKISRQLFLVKQYLPASQPAALAQLAARNVA